MVRMAVFGIGVKDGHIMDDAMRRLNRDDIQITVGDGMVLDEDLDKFADFIRMVPEFDFMTIHVHGDVSYFKHFVELKNALEKSKCSAFLTCTEAITTAEYKYLFKQSDDDYRLIKRFQENGGDDNQYSTLLWVMNTFGGCSYDVPDPIIPNAQGVYIPGKGILTLEEGLKDVGKSGKPVIGVFFHQRYWLVHNTEAIDFLVKKVEDRGAECVPMFMITHPNPDIGSIGIAKVCEEYLIRDGKPIVDCVVNTMGFSQTLIADPGSGEQVSDNNFFAKLDVPILQAVSLYCPPREWEENPFGFNSADIAMSVVNPEFDGQIDTVPYGGPIVDSTGFYRQFAIPDRCEAIAEMAYRWAMLRRIPNTEKKIAILIYMYPPRQDLAGGGYGLDTLQSVSDLLHSMGKAGYSLDWLPENGKELVTRLLEGVTNDDNWASDSQLRKAAVDLVSVKQYEEWFRILSDSVRERWEDSWGEPPGPIHTLDGKFLLPGIMNGNVFIGFQPDRGKCTVESIHDPRTAPPHQYLAFYRWLRDVWGADGLIHMGTHGTLEWLPGKSAGLSKDCDPDIILGGMPNVNPYIIDNPGEGMQAKRRSYCVITTHMIPAMMRSGGYDKINELENAVQAYIKAKEHVQPDKLPLILEKVLTSCRELNFLNDIGLDENATVEDLEDKVDNIYDMILEIKDAMIKDGLHILGEVPTGARMTEMVYSLVRYANGDIPSLREEVAKAFGLNLNLLLAEPSEMSEDGFLNGEHVNQIDGICYELIQEMQWEGFDLERSLEIVHEAIPEPWDEIDITVRFVCGFLKEAITRMPDEIDSVIHALDGGYVLPGPAGCPNRGRAQILPTGRNFYSIDPDGVPWHSSWDVGSQMAEQMVERYVSENGTYPKTVGIIVWATDTMKTGGDDVSYILKLMGLRPVWTGYGGRVKDLEVIPLSELGRPRIDVTLRISGLFRDTFPNLCRLIDDGVRKIAYLDEGDEENYLAANLRKDTVEAIASGIPPDEARKNAAIRIFGDAPGQYGSGISDAVQKGDWQTVDDLGEVYVRNGCYVYGRGLKGEAQPDLFRKRLKVMEVTVKNHNTRAVDMLDMDDDFDALGGMNAAVRAISGKAATSFMGDSSDTQNLKLRTTQEEIRFIFRSKIDNPKWLEGLKKHGFAGAKELSKLFDYTLGWSATSDIVEKWMYDDLTERFVLDKETREWIKDENPYAMISMLQRLQEAFDRKLWDADPEMLEKLKDVYLEFEERFEEITDR